MNGSRLERYNGYFREITDAAARTNYRTRDARSGFLAGSTIVTVQPSNFSEIIISNYLERFSVT